VSNTEIPDAAIERNRAWIAALTNSLGRRGDSELVRETMRDTGKKCAEQLLKKIIDHFGRSPESADELIEAINMRRKEVLNASNFWSRDGNKAHFKLEKCGCDLVEAGLAEPNPNYCLCSAGMFESLFIPFCRGTARTEIIKAIGFGDNCCEFVVHFEE
jgi:hypothetical protein